MFTELVKVDLTIGTRKRRLKGVAMIRLVSWGKWEIDKEKGKTILLIEVKLPGKAVTTNFPLELKGAEGIAVNFPPSDDFYVELIDKMLQHEMENDSFLFKHPKIDPNRPSQLKVKIDKIEEVLEKWRLRAKVITQSTTSQNKPSPEDFYAKQLDGTWRRATAPPKADSELKRLRLNWKQVINQAPEDSKRTPVFAILRSAGVKPAAVEGNTVVLAFRYPYHKEQIEKLENQEMTEKIIGNFLGHSCHVRCICEPEDDHLLKAALKMGAQIIDVEGKGTI